MDPIKATDWIDKGWGPRRVHRPGQATPPATPADEPFLHRWLVRLGLRSRVTCRFRGQLGNQLFQIAATISHARRVGAFAFIPDWAYRRVFNCTLPTGLSTEGMAIFDEDRAGPGELGSRRDVILFGNFQSLDFFDEPLVRRTLRFHPDIIRYVRRRYGDLLAARTAGLHVRRGDTLAPENPMRVLSPNYYERALELLPDVETVAVFSDDIAWCRERFRGPRFRFVEGEENFVDLCLMSLCAHHVICNSTFSWWGAWLNAAPDRKVVVPAVWYKSEFARFDHPNRYPAHWMAIEP